MHGGLRYHIADLSAYPLNIHLASVWPNQAFELTAAAESWLLGCRISANGGWYMAAGGSSMVELISVLKDTNIPTIAAAAGVFLIILAVGVEGVIKLPQQRQKPAGIVGATLFLIGIGLFLAPNPGSQAPTASAGIVPTVPAENTALPATIATTNTATASMPVSQTITSTRILSAPTPSTLPEGFHRLEETIYGRFDPNVPGNVVLDAGRIYRVRDEREGRYCRAEFPPDGAIWVLCVNIGKPEPTQPPPSRIPLPATQTPTPEPIASVTYRVDIVKISIEQMKTLPGCESLGVGNNVCIVGSGGIDLELFNYQEKATYGPMPTDVRQLYIREENRTRVTIVSDQSGLPVITIGNNELVPELGQYYKILVKKVE
jgi:hypothetical protein